jgi:hypothetical protein
LNFNYFLLYWAILILSSTQQHFRLAGDVSEDVANIVFNKAALKVIKDAIKHARLVSISMFYTLVLKQVMKPTLVHGIYLTKEQHLQGR